MALGTAALPRAGRVVAMAGLALMMLPIDFNAYQLEEYGATYADIDRTFAVLRDNLLPGDAVLVDPRCGCAPVEAWDYYLRLHFPTGLPFTQDATGKERVWYVSRNWDRDDAIFDAVSRGRVAGKYIGPPEFFIQLYEQPPDTVGILFDNGIRFHGMQVLDRAAWPTGPVYHEDESIRVRLWWSADRPIDRDYSIGVYVVFGDDLVQVDRPTIINGPVETSQWTPGTWLIDEREIPIPPAVEPGRFTILAAVYGWWDQVRIPAPGATDDNGLLPLTTILVHSW